MSWLSERLMDALLALQIPKPAYALSGPGYAMSAGCRSTCSGSCDGSCSGDCDSSCAGECEESCSGGCTYSCYSECQDGEY